MGPSAIEVNYGRHQQLRLTVNVHRARNASQKEPGEAIGLIRTEYRV